jgi:hypothetical protein
MLTSPFFLCTGRAVAYELRSDLSVSDDWLYSKEIPNIGDRYQDDNRFCRLLALALLWETFDVEARAKLFIFRSVIDSVKTDCLHRKPIPPTIASNLLVGQWIGRGWSWRYLEDSQCAIVVKDMQW